VAVTSPESVCGGSGSARRPVVALGLLAAGWAAFLVADRYTRRLTEHWGPAPDVVDVLNRARFVGRRILPYYAAAVLLDAGAGLAFLARSRRGWPVVIKAVTGIVLVPTAWLHGLAFLAWCFWAA
jgi:hypothetical protein